MSLILLGWELHVSCIMWHPNLVSFAFYAIPIFYIQHFFLYITPLISNVRVHLFAYSLQLPIPCAAPYMPGLNPLCLCAFMSSWYKYLIPHSAGISMGLYSKWFVWSYKYVHVHVYTVLYLQYKVPRRRACTCHVTLFIG